MTIPNPSIPATPVFQSAIGNRQSAISPRTAFTLIELLVVIGIILILIGLFFAGAKIVTAGAKEKDTKIALSTCQTMLDNYKAVTHFTRPPPQGPGPAPLTPSTINVSDPLLGSKPSFWTAGVELPPTSALSSDSSSYTMSPGGFPQAIANTAYVMYALESIPDNNKIITSLPPSKLINVNIIVAQAGAPNGALTVSVPLIRDGWGNPILFVPGGGIGSPNSAGAVWFDGSTYGIINSNGIINNLAPANPASANLGTYDPADSTQFPNGPASAPFFVSAGPDGDVSNTQKPDKTDDNIYSFRN